MNTSNTAVNTDPAEANEIEELSAHELEEVSGGAIVVGTFD